MTTRTDTLKVRYEVDGQGRVAGSFSDTAKGLDGVAQAGDRATASTQRLATASKIAGAAIGTALAVSITAVIRNTSEAERVNAQLGAAVSSLGSKAASSAPQIDRMATAMMRMSTFDDEKIKEAGTALLAFTNIKPDQFERALGSALDVATRKSMDLVQAADLVGKALNDPVKGLRTLRELGITFSKDQQAVIKSLLATGKAGEAQALILDQLEMRFEGAAEAARDTFGGAVTGLSNALANLTEGDSGSLDGAKDALNQLTETMESEQVKSAFGSIVAGLANMTSFAAAAIAKFVELSEAKTLALGGAASSSSDSGINARLAQVSERAARIRQAQNGSAADRFMVRGEALVRADVTEMGTYTLEGELKKLQDERTQLIREQTRRIRREAAGNVFAQTRGAVDTTGEIPNAFEDSTKPKKQSAGKTEAERQAERVKKAVEDMTQSQREYQTELSSVGAKAIDDYSKRLSEITDKAEEFTRKGVPKEKVDAFVASMRELAESIKSKELAEFQREFEEETSNLAATQEGPGAEAARAYAAAMVEVKEKLDDGLITTQQYQRREEALAGQRRQAATEVLRGLRDEIELTGLSDQAKERTIALRQANVDAMSDEGQKIIEAVDKLREAREAESIINDLGAATGDLASAAIDHFSQAGDAAEEFEDRLKKMAIRLFTDKLIQWAISAFFGGGTLGGESAGTLSDLNASGDSGFGFAKGAAFDGTVKRFAKGSTFANAIVNKPTRFSFAKGTALGEMGEAGPEGIFPLKRMADGSLGVAGDAGGAPNVEVTVNKIGNGDGDVTTDIFSKGGKLIVQLTLAEVERKLSTRGSSMNNAMLTGLGRGTQFGG